MDQAQKLRNMVKIQNLSYRYRNEKNTLENINIEIREREVTAIIR